MKTNGAPQEQITQAVKKLKGLKLGVEEEEKKYQEPAFDRDGFESVLLRRMIVVPSFEIYGGEKGLFDLGTEGSFLMDNIVDLWKKHFVIKENMLMIRASCLTPEPVLKTSGHVDRFQDLMCKDMTTGNCYRADKLLEDHLEQLLETAAVKTNPKVREEYELIYRQADAFSVDELHEVIQRFGIKSPETGSELSKPFPFNLMFATSIGPEGNKRGYLRPETAQGMFVNFKRLLERKGGKLPFACAQVGLGFRNEISPRNGLIRVREFMMAELEHFVDPNNKTHPRFADVAALRVTLFPKENQLGNGKLISTTVGTAVSKGIIANETLGYFLARTHLFFLKIGINLEKLRFRQHLDTQMAHYACDCWDGEIKMSYGWIECVGLADRSCYDLKVHSEATKVDLVASRKLDTPKVIPVAKVKLNKGLIGKQYKKEAAPLLSYLEQLQESGVEMAMDIESKLASQGSATVTVDGTDFLVDRAMASYSKGEKKIYAETFYPHVIEPAFGVGRIFNAVLEHSYYTREEQDAEEPEKKEKSKNKNEVRRFVLGLNPLVAPIKCAVFPLQNKAEFTSKVEQLKDMLTDTCGINVDADTSSVSIGKRYARMDELGVPFALTVDEATLEGKGPTLRERDSTQQVRLPESRVASVILALAKGTSTWPEVVAEFGLL